MQNKVYYRAQECKYMNYGKSFNKSKASDVKTTPQELFDYWNDIFRFQLDVCANSENAKCPIYYDEKNDGLSQEWAKVNWCNPPYSSGQIAKWLKKGKEEQAKGGTTVFLLPCDVSTGWYWENIKNNPNCSEVPIKGRVRFGGAKINSPFGSSIVIFWATR